MSHHSPNSNNAIWSILIVVLLSAFFGIARTLAASVQRPNVVLFLVDDMGYGDFAVHGNRFVNTPNLDALARESTELTRFYVSPVCSPTRASLLTGRYNFRTGVSDVFGEASEMAAGEVTVAEALRAGGYVTGLFGKWHLGDAPERSPNAQGFDEVLSFKGPTLRPRYHNPILWHNGSQIEKEGYCTDIFVDAAIDFIEENRSRPFFAYISTNVIHAPLEIKPEQMRKFINAGVSESTARIYGMIENLDANLGRLLLKLKALGLEENTLVIFTSDNGPASESHLIDRNMAGLRGLKGTVYENGVRVPCFLRWPGIVPSGASVARMTAHIDMMPTILTACGVTVDEGTKMDGLNLLPLVIGKSGDWPDRTIFLQWDSGVKPRHRAAFAAISEKRKLVQAAGIDHSWQKHILDTYSVLAHQQGRKVTDISGGPRVELFAIDTDPGEVRDISAEEPETVRKLLEKYDQWFSEVTGSNELSR